MALEYRSIKLIVFVLLAVALFFGSFIFIYLRSQPEPPSIVKYNPYRKDILKKVVASGSLQPIKEVLIKAYVSGVVEEIMVRPGQEVRTGDVLARLRIIPDLVKTSSAESTLRKAQLQLQNGEKDLAKKKALFQKELIPEEEVRSTTLELKLRQEEFSAATRNLALLKEGRAGDKNGVAHTSYNEISATTSGVVLDVAARVGQFVTALNDITDGTTIATIADMSQLIFKGKVPESDVNSLAAGMPLEIIIAALKNEKLPGRLTFVSPRGTDEDGSVKFEVRADIDTEVATTSLRAGYSANIDIITDKHENVLAVKLIDVFVEDGQSRVLVSGNGGPKEHRDVELGSDDGFDVEILNGLAESDLVISK